MKILITGGRSVLAVDWANRLKKQHTVHVCDSKRIYLSRAYFGIKCHRTSSPNDLIKLIDKYEIDIVLPCNEETLHVVNALGNGLIVVSGRPVLVLSTEIRRLDEIHNKFTFNKLLVDLGFKAPLSFQCESLEEVSDVLSDQFPGKVVLKPSYSRGSTKTIIYSDTKKPIDLKPVIKSISDNDPWVIQEMLQGEEYCVYAFCVNGKVYSQVTYKHMFHVDGGTGIHFKAVDLPHVREWVESFVSAIQFTGQISFDVFDVAGEVYAIECNPRGTSGFHLMPKSIICLLDLAYAQLVANETDDLDIFIDPDYERECQVFLAMLFFGPSKWKSWKKFKQWCRAIIRAKDPSLSKVNPIPLLYQLLVSTEFMIESFVKGYGMMDAATADIAWNLKDHLSLKEGAREVEE